MLFRNADRRDFRNNNNIIYNIRTFSIYCTRVGNVCTLGAGVGPKFCDIFMFVVLYIITVDILLLLLPNIRFEC